MATGTNIKTYFEGTWHDGDVPIMPRSLTAPGISKASPPIWKPIARG